MQKRESKFVDSYFSKPWIEPLLSTFDPKRFVCPSKTGYMKAQVISVKEGCSDSLLDSESDFEIYGFTNVHDGYVRTGAVFTKQAIEQFEEYEEALTGCEFEHLPNCIIMLKKFHIIPKIVEDLHDCDLVICIEDFSLYTHAGPTCTISSLPCAKSTYSVSCSIHRLWSSAQVNTDTSEESGLEALTNSDNLTQLLAEFMKDQSLIQSSQSGEGTQLSASQIQNGPVSGPETCGPGLESQDLGTLSQSDDGAPGKSKDQLDGGREQDGDLGSSSRGEEEGEMTLKWRHVHQLSSWVFEVRPPRSSSASAGDVDRDEMEEVVKWVTRCLERLPDVADNEEESSLEKDATPAGSTQESQNAQSSTAPSSTFSRRKSRRGKRRSPVIKKPMVLRGNSCKVDAQEHEEKMMCERIKKQLPTTEMIILSPDDIKPLPPEFDLDDDDSDDSPQFGDLNNNVQLQEWDGDSFQAESLPSHTNGQQNSNSTSGRSTAINRSETASRELSSLQKYTTDTGQSSQSELADGQHGSNSAESRRNDDSLALKGTGQLASIQEYTPGTGQSSQSELGDGQHDSNSAASRRNDDSLALKDTGQLASIQEYTLEAGQSIRMDQEDVEHLPDSGHFERNSQEVDESPLDILSSQKEMDEILQTFSQELSQDANYGAMDAAVETNLSQNTPSSPDHCDSFGQTYIIHHHDSQDEASEDQTIRESGHSSRDDETEIPASPPIPSPYPLATVSSPLLEKRCLMPSTSSATQSESSQSDFVLDMSGDSDFTVLKCSIDDRLQKADGTGDHKELSAIGSDSDSDIFSPRSPKICPRSNSSLEESESFPEVTDSQSDDLMSPEISSGDICCVLSAEDKDDVGRGKQRRPSDFEDTDIGNEDDHGAGKSLTRVAETSRKRKQSDAGDDCDKRTSIEKRLRFADPEQGSPGLDESSQMDVGLLVQDGKVLTSTQKDGSDVAVQETIFVMSSDEGISQGDGADREVSRIPSAGLSGWISKQEMMMNSRSGRTVQTINESESEDTGRSQTTHSTNAGGRSKQHSEESPILIQSSSGEGVNVVPDSVSGDTGRSVITPTLAGTSKKQHSKDSPGSIQSSDAHSVNVVPDSVSGDAGRSEIMPTLAETSKKQHSKESPVLIQLSDVQSVNVIPDSASGNTGHSEITQTLAGSREKQRSEQSSLAILSSGAQASDFSEVKSHETNSSVKDTVQRSVGPTPSAGSSRSSDRTSNYSVTPVLFSSEESPRSANAVRPPLEQHQGQMDKTVLVTDPRHSGRDDQEGLMNLSQHSDSRDGEELMSIDTPEDSLPFTQEGLMNLSQHSESRDGEESMSIGTPEDYLPFTQEGTALPPQPFKESNNVKSPTETFTRIKRISLSSSGRHFLRNAQIELSPVCDAVTSNGQSKSSVRALGNETRSQVEKVMSTKGQRSDNVTSKLDRDKNKSNPSEMNDMPAKNACNDSKTDQQKRDVSSLGHSQVSKKATEEPKHCSTQSVASSKIYMGPMKMKQMTLKKEKKPTATPTKPSRPCRSDDITTNQPRADPQTSLNTHISSRQSSKKAKSDNGIKSFTGTTIDTTTASSSDIRFTSLGKSPSGKGATPRKRQVSQPDESHHASNGSCSSNASSATPSSSKRRADDSRKRSKSRRKEQGRLDNSDHSSRSPVIPLSSQDQDENDETALTDSMLNGTYLPPSDDSSSTEGEEALLEWCARYLLESSKR